MTTYTSKAIYSIKTANAAPLFAAATAFSDFAQPEASGVNGGSQSSQDDKSTFLWRPEHFRDRVHVRNRVRKRSGHPGIAWTLRLVDEGDHHYPPPPHVFLCVLVITIISTTFLFLFHNNNTFLEISHRG